jgi:hypothetical protein
MNTKTALKSSAGLDHQAYHQAAFNGEAGPMALPCLPLAQSGRAERAQKYWRVRVHECRNPRGRQFASKNDPDWKTLAQWVTGRTAQKE